MVQNVKVDKVCRLNSDKLERFNFFNLFFAPFAGFLTNREERMRTKTALVKILLLAMVAFSSAVQAFDLEDYATTYRSTRDAYLKSGNELRLAQGPFSAAAKAWIEVEMAEQLKAGNTAAVEHLIKLKSKVAQCGI